MQTADSKPSAPPAPAVELQHVVRRFGTVEALAGVSLSIRRGEFFSVLGPSGCGKSTLLRVIAGLDVPDSGAVRIGGVDALRLPAWKRPVNTVFQSYALFPHLSVSENVAFGLRMKRLSAHDIVRRTAAVLELTQLTPLAGRHPHELSGGQRQRVALARAIVNEPDVLLLDEPLGALDAKLRTELQLELRQLHQRLGTTFIHVTHDQDEAMAMSDRVAILNAGRVVQLGTPEELYERPKSRFVAEFIGACNALEGRFFSRRGTLLEADTPLGRMRIELPGTAVEQAEQERLHIGVRPERISLEGGRPGDNHFLAQVESILSNGPESHIQVRVGQTLLRVVELNTGRRSVELFVGDSVEVAIPPANFFLMES